MQALDALLNRVSVPRLLDPAPTAEQREVLFAAAMRAPDHGHLQPWRFLTVEGQAREQLGEILAQAALAQAFLTWNLALILLNEGVIAVFEISGWMTWYAVLPLLIHGVEVALVFAVAHRRRLVAWGLHQLRHHRACDGGAGVCARQHPQQRRPAPARTDPSLRHHRTRHHGNADLVRARTPVQRQAHGAHGWPYRRLSAFAAPGARRRPCRGAQRRWRC